MPPENLTPATLRIVRLALFGGVLLFGAVVLFLQRGGSTPELGVAFTGRLVTLVFVTFGVATAAALIAIRSAQERAPGFTQKATLGIIGWAIGEAVALSGGVLWLLSGRPTLYLFGLAIFLVALLAIPVPEEPSVGGMM